MHWTRGNTELNYRRFFAVTTLAGVRVEDPDVFAATHARVRDWAEAGVTGLRIDHPDGLVDPGQYLRRLRRAGPGRLDHGGEDPGTGRADAGGLAGGRHDRLRRHAGGQRRLHRPGAEEAFTELYQRLTGDHHSIAEHIEIGKRMVVTELLPAEVSRMAALVPDVPQAGAALAEVAVAFAVYRSYLPAGAEQLDAALARAASGGRSSATRSRP